MGVVEHLAGKIGRRSAGSPGEEKAARYIAGRFRAAGLKTELRPFGFMGWDHRASSTVEILAPVRRRLDSCPLLYSAGTAGPAVGELTPAGRQNIMNYFWWDRFAVGRRPDGRPAAYLVGRPNGPAAAMPLNDPLVNYPVTLVGREDFAWLKRRLARGKVRARVNIKARFKPDATSWNVVGEIPGKKKPREVILVGGHHDTVYNSPGANDNASGIAGLVQLARELSGRRFSRTIRFVSFGAEEFLMIGSQAYVRQLKEHDELKRVKAVIILDMIGCNAPNWLWVTDDKLNFKRRLTPILKRLKIAERYGPVEWIIPPWDTSDHTPFQYEGIPCFVCTWHGDIYPHTHLPSDKPDQVDERVFKDTLDLVRPVLVQLAGKA